MAWILSTGAQLALLNAQPTVVASVIGSDISFGDGNGTSGRDTIAQVAAGLNVFAVDDYVLIIGGANNGKMVRLIAVTAAAVEVSGSSWSGATAAGTATCLVKITSGAFSRVFQNARLDIRTSTRPISGDLTEAGTLLCTITKNGGTFVAGTSTNGLNLGVMSGTTLQRDTDPVTGLPEVWRGAISSTGTAGHAVLYANAVVTGASTTSVRAYGTVNTSGADVNIATGLSFVAGVNAEVTSISATVAGV